jgi:SAM-dependent methyltransferase
MTWVLAALIAVYLADAWRMRTRLSALSVLPPDADGPAAADHRFIVAPGVTLAAPTMRAASAFARDKGLVLVDLVPRDLPAVQAMSLAQLVDPRKFRRYRLATGRSAGHAILVTADVAQRAGLGDADPIAPADQVAFYTLAARLRHYAGAAADLAVAPAERTVAVPIERRGAILAAVVGWLATGAMIAQLALWTVMGLGVWLAPEMGIAAIAAWHLQPVIAIAGTPVRSRGLVVAALLRAPLELVLMIGTVLGRWKPPAGPDPVETRRPEYERLAAAPEKLWEPRRDSCPVCEAKDLAVHLRVRDMLQHKPGRFTLERCRGCGHIFQNPRLSIAGLDFYYKDFYDGLGEAGMEMIFGFGDHSYRQRAKMMKAHAAPATWLDVGAGHGHFCASARDDLPDTRFDGLDLSESIDEAQRRGWIENKFRGLFPELAPGLAGRYEAVSMSHYLEHTLDPRAELAAARTVLAPGGHLLIEVPDPEFGFGKLLGRLWLPWFQPQHLHFVSTKNLDKLLREHGFTPVEWHRGRAHQRVDLMFAVMLALGVLAPPSRLPWRKPGPLAGLRRAVVWTIGAPFLLLGIIGDQVLAPFIERGKRSNTYRVLARRE